MEQVTILTNETDIKKIVNDIVNELKKNEQPIEEQPQERLLTSAETCAFLRCSKPTLHRMKKNGTIPFIRFGKNIRYKQSDLEKLIETKGK
ncbi:MAG: Helix-turn-helix domain [Bacteroidota bacterium]|jgi:excisionase family DNA binding protein|nr:Helix-turn-helix domain [Bacteroidota bacterium]